MKLTVRSLPKHQVIQATNKTGKNCNHLPSQGLETSKTQFASSPNLSSLVARDDLPKSKLKRFESVSTSNLGPKAISDKTSKFNRMTPNLLKNKNSSLKGEKVLDGKSKLQSKCNLVYS